MNTELSPDCPRSHESSPLPLLAPRWDQLFSTSRPLLSPLIEVVMAEAANAFGTNDHAHSACRLTLLEILIRGYSIGLLSSRDIESSLRTDSHWSVESKELSPSSNDLRQFRRQARLILERCLARLYWLAWAEQSPPTTFIAIEVIDSQDAQDHRWASARSEARNRLEWAYFTDSVESD